MATVEARCKIRDVTDIPGPHQRADGEVIRVKEVGETIAFAQLMGYWDRPNVANQWFNNYPLLSAKPELVEAAALDRAGRVDWLNTYIPSDAGVSFNWGIQDLRIHQVFVVDNWPEQTLPIGTYPMWSEDGTEITTVEMVYTGRLPPGIEEMLRDNTLWSPPWWENQASGTGFEFTDYAVVTTAPPPA